MPIRAPEPNEASASATAEASSRLELLDQGYDILEPSVKSDESATESPSHRAPSEWTLDEWDVLTEPPSETNLQHSQLLERMHALEVEVARLKLALAQQGGASTSTATCDVPLNAVASIEDGLETSSSGSIPCSKAATDPFIEGSEVEDNLSEVEAPEEVDQSLLMDASPNMQAVAENPTPSAPPALPSTAATTANTATVTAPLEPLDVTPTGSTGSTQSPALPERATEDVSELTEEEQALQWAILSSIQEDTTSQPTHEGPAAPRSEPHAIPPTPQHTAQDARHRAHAAHAFGRRGRQGGPRGPPFGHFGRGNVRQASWTSGSGCAVEVAVEWPGCRHQRRRHRMMRAAHARHGHEALPVVAAVFVPLMYMYLSAF